MSSKVIDVLLGLFFLFFGFGAVFVLLYFMSMGLSYLKLPLMIFGLLVLMFWDIFPEIIKAMSVMGIVVGVVISFI